MKEMFESTDVSENIHKWIDLIFGYKQRGQAAIEACNLYPSITYEDGIDLNKPDNIEMKDSLISQAYNYGQCPTQLLNEPHSKKEEEKFSLAFIDKDIEIQDKTYDFNRKKYGTISDAKFIDGHTLVMFSNKKQLYGLEYHPYTGDGKKDIFTDKKEWKKKKIIFDDSKILIDEHTPIKILTKGDLRMIVGGYWDGKITIHNFTKSTEKFKKKHLFRVTMIEVSDSEDIVITGSERGDIVKWTLEGTSLKFQKPFFHHQNTVTGAYISEDMGVFATCSKDATVNLYTIDPPYILRTFKQPCETPLSRVLISETPLASIIMITQDMKRMDSFSINGKHLADVEDPKEIINPMILVDKHFCERLVYGNLVGKLMTVRLPYFDQQNIQHCLEKSSVTPLALTPDRRVLIYFNLGLC